MIIKNLITLILVAVLPTLAFTFVNAKAQTLTPRFEAALTTPVLETFFADADTYVASGPAWVNNPRGNSNSLYIGYGDLQTYDLQKARAFLQFDLRSLGASKPVQVNSATLRLFLTDENSENSNQTMMIEVHPVTASWQEMAVTWNTVPPHDTTIASTSVGTVLNRWVEWVLPVGQVQQWVNNRLIAPSGAITFSLLPNDIPGSPFILTVAIQPGPAISPREGLVTRAYYLPIMLQRSRYSSANHAGFSSVAETPRP